MKNFLIFVSSLALAGFAFGDNFHPAPGIGVFAGNRDDVYTLYDSYLPLTSEQAKEDGADVVRFADKIWRGRNQSLLKSRIKDQTLMGKSIRSAVLLRQGDQWLELGMVLVGAEGGPGYAFLVYQWDKEQGGVRKSSFVLNEWVPYFELCGAMKIGRNLAVIELGNRRHEWEKWIVVDLSTLKPVGEIDGFNFHIIKFEPFKTLKVRYQGVKTRAMMMAEPERPDDEHWEKAGVILNGRLNPALKDRSLFSNSVPAVP